MSEAQNMWRCSFVNCGYIYDPVKGDHRTGIPAGTGFGDLPDNWYCPVCGTHKELFNRVGPVRPPKAADSGPGASPPQQDAAPARHEAQ